VEACLEFMRLSKTPLFSGDDPLALPLIAMGAKGSISITGNIRPKEWSNFIQKALSGDIEGAKKLYSSLHPVCQAMVLETNPQCIKYAMSLEGHCFPVLRLPLIPPPRKNTKTD
jgi:4-hydroxy-tetrahydrodipicolinate synthase